VQLKELGQLKKKFKDVIGFLQAYSIAPEPTTLPSYIEGKWNKEWQPERSAQGRVRWQIC
jgi:hypothetical protein